MKIICINETLFEACRKIRYLFVSQGKCIFSSGSPFGEVHYNGKVYKPGQGNNAYIFPGIALGVIATGCHHITEDLFLISAQAVADHVKDEDLEVGSLYPPLSTIRECSIDIAVRIANYAYAKSKFFEYVYLSLIFQINNNIQGVRTKIVEH